MQGKTFPQRLISWIRAVNWKEIKPTQYFNCLEAKWIWKKRNPPLVPWHCPFPDMRWSFCRWWCCPQPGWREWRSLQWRHRLQLVWGLVVKTCEICFHSGWTTFALIKSPDGRPQMEFPQTALWGTVTDSLWEFFVTLKGFRGGVGEVLFSCWLYSPPPPSEAWMEQHSGSLLASLVCFEV